MHASFVATSRSRLLTAVRFVPVAMLLATSLSFAPSVGADGLDSDLDGLFDEDEIGYYLTNPNLADTDGDGYSDGEEVYYNSDPLSMGSMPGARVDSDNDGLFDDDEMAIYLTNPAVFDTDGDGYGDGDEIYNGMNPLVAEGMAPGGGDPGGGGNPGGGDPGGGGNPGGGIPVGDTTCLDAEEMAYLSQINALRTGMGLAPVQVSATLTLAADGHSRDMGVRQFTAHTNPDGVTDMQRMFNAGYVPGNPYELAENIFYGDATGAGAFNWWLNSPGHYAHMVDPDLVAIGIARVETPGSPFGWYWTTDHANQFDAPAASCQ